LSRPKAFVISRSSSMGFCFSSDRFIDRIFWSG
jgi:hypothetical protein